MNAEYSPVRRFSAFVEVPVRWLQPQGFSAHTSVRAVPESVWLSDVTAGFKFAAIASEGTYFTFQFKSYLPPQATLRKVWARTTTALSLRCSCTISFQPIHDEGQVGRLAPHRRIGGSSDYRV